MTARVADRRRLVLFNLYHLGHHPEHICYLAEHWRTTNCPDELIIVVSPEFVRVEGELVCELEGAGVKVASVTAEEYAAHLTAAHRDVTFASFVKMGPGEGDRATVEWNLFCDYARRKHATHALLLYADSLLFALAGPHPQLAPAPCAYSAIYFEPAFYDDENTPLRDPGARLQERFILKSAMAQPQLQSIFMFDPYAVAVLNRVSPKAEFVPDPVPAVRVDPQLVKALRLALGIEPHRRVFLLFGVLSRRKGITEVLRALDLLPANLGEKLCLVLAGEIEEELRSVLVMETDPLKAKKGIQIVTDLRHIPGPEVAAYFQLADIVLIAYLSHIGSSGVQVRAAAASKPVISSQYGLIGKFTREHHLGLTVDPRDPASIAAGIVRALESPSAAPGNLDEMHAFAAARTPAKFAATIFDNLERKGPIQ